jgi:hypothetical protein
MTITNPLVASIFASTEALIRRSLSFDLALIEPTFIEYYSRLKAGGRAKDAGESGVWIV